MHPKQVIHLEHDGKVLLVDDEGNGPMKPVQGRNGGGPNLRFPTLSEVESLGLPVQQKGTTVLRFGEDSYEVLKGYPKIDWKELGMEGQLHCRQLCPPSCKGSNIPFSTSSRIQSHGSKLKR